MTKVDATHDPEARPLGCNGRYGVSGAAKHLYHKEPVCELCGASRRHYQRERKRGRLYPRKLYPCGTRAGALRHRAHGEERCFPCALAEAEYTERVKQGLHKKPKPRRARGKLAA